MTLADRLRNLGLWYLASPYTGHPDGQEEAFRQAALAAAWCVRRRVSVFCPVVHLHPVATIGGLDPLDHSIWIPMDRPLMHRCDGMLILQIPGWNSSKGVNIESEVFRSRGLPIEFLQWPLPEEA